MICSACGHDQGEHNGPGTECRGHVGRDQCICHHFRQEAMPWQKEAPK